MDSTFTTSSTDLIASICSWKVLFTSGLFLVWLNCSFRKDILSSITCCKLITILYLVKPSPRRMVISWLAPLGDRVLSCCCWTSASSSSSFWFFFYIVNHYCYLYTLWAKFGVPCCFLNSVCFILGYY
jgi:hypothetical protein